MNMFIWEQNCSGNILTNSVYTQEAWGKKRFSKAQWGELHKIFCNNDPWLQRSIIMVESVQNQTDSCWAGVLVEDGFVWFWRRPLWLLVIRQICTFLSLSLFLSSSSPSCSPPSLLYFLPSFFLFYFNTKDRAFMPSHIPEFMRPLKASKCNSTLSSSLQKKCIPQVHFRLLASRTVKSVLT